jgi:hypothetical protein
MPGGHGTDAKEFRAQAAQACWIAGRALTDQDQKFWLRLADEWYQLTLQAELGRLSPATFKRVQTMGHLLQSENHVIRGERHIERQREIVARPDDITNQTAIRSFDAGGATGCPRRRGYLLGSRLAAYILHDVQHGNAV